VTPTDGISPIATRWRSFSRCTGAEPSEKEKRRERGERGRDVGSEAREPERKGKREGERAGAMVTVALGRERVWRD
jgi:hypothetical protein